MATQLNEGQELSRELRVYGVESPVIITITHDGLKARIPRTKNAVEIAWVQLFEKVAPPMCAKSYIQSAYAFLVDQAKKMVASAQKRAS